MTFHLHILNELSIKYISFNFKTNLIYYIILKKHLNLFSKNNKHFIILFYQKTWK
jgi:hypothetical protein